MEARENKGQTLLAVAIGCYALAFIGTAARIYVRRYLVGVVGLDDWLIIASLVCSMDVLVLPSKFPNYARLIFESRFAARCFMQGALGWKSVIHEETY